MGLTGYLAFTSLVTVGAFSATSNLAATIFNTVGNLSQQMATFRSVEPIFEKFNQIKSDSPKGNKKINQIDAGIVLQDVDRKSTRLNSSHVAISYAVFCLK